MSDDTGYPDDEVVVKRLFVTQYYEVKMTANDIAIMERDGVNHDNAEEILEWLGNDLADCFTDEDTYFAR